MQAIFSTETQRLGNYFATGGRKYAVMFVFTFYAYTLDAASNIYLKLSKRKQKENKYIVLNQTSIYQI